MPVSLDAVNTEPGTQADLLTAPRGRRALASLIPIVGLTAVYFFKVPWIAWVWFCSALFPTC